MAGSRSEKAAETRRKLIETAKKSFSENGYNGTSVRDISKSIGVSESLLYHYFPNGKRELLSEIMKNELDDFRKNVPDNDVFDVFDGLSIEDSLKSICTRLSGFINEHIDLIRIVILEKEVRDFIRTEDMNRYLDGLENFLCELLRTRMDKGEIHDVDCRAAAMVMRSMLLNMVLLSILGITCSEQDSEEKGREVFLRLLNIRKEDSN